MKFGVRGHLNYIITCVKFLVDRFRGYGVLATQKLPFPIDLLRRPYSSVRTAVRHCDHHVVVVVVVVAVVLVVVVVVVAAAAATK